MVAEECDLAIAEATKAVHSKPLGNNEILLNMITQVLEAILDKKGM